MMSDVTDITREIVRKRAGKSGVAGAVKQNAWSHHEAMINGARNDLRTLEHAHDRAVKRYEDAKVEFLATGDRLDAAKARLAGLLAQES
jgi:acylphosphatase